MPLSKGARQSDMNERVCCCDGVIAGGGGYSYNSGCCFSVRLLAVVFLAFLYLILQHRKEGNEE